MNRIFIAALVLFFSANYAFAQDVNIDSWLVKSPLIVEKPAFISGADINKEEFTTKNLLTENYIDLYGLLPVKGGSWNTVKPGKEGFVEIKALKKTSSQVSYLAFYLETAGLDEIKIEVESPQMFEVYLEGKKISSNYTLADEGKTVKRTGTIDADPGKYLIIVKSLYTDVNKNIWKLKAILSGVPERGVVLSTVPEEKMSIHHLLEGTKLGSMSLSPDGKYVAVTYSKVDPQSGKTEGWTEIKESASAKLIQSFRKDGTTGYRWMPLGNRIYYTERKDNLSTVWVYDFDSAKEYPLIENIAEMSGFSWAPDCSFIIYNVRETEKSGGKSSLKYMDELGNRTFRATSYNQLYKYDLATKTSSRLTFGKPGASLNDISHNGKFIVFSSSRPNPTQRPFTLQNMYLMDLEKGEVKTLWKDFRWSGYASFSPDDKKLLVSGGPDTFGETGRNIGDQELANNYDGQLYIYDLASGEVDPISVDFNPSIGSATWHTSDNKIYLSASDEVYSRLFCWDEESREFRKIDVEPDILSGLNIAAGVLKAAYSGTSMSKHKRGWLIDLASGESSLFENPEEETYRNVKFGRDGDWNFKMPDGREIKGYMMYPVDFDASKKYPLIVNYYGGTSPVEKSFGGRYPMEIWAASGYVVFVPQPSGATGFGQEFSARHQNTWGMDAADEIIEGTKQFLAAHDFVDPEKVGCIGASYGGFMTMLLQTKTDIFACAISHAGISSISSYWGEGYWGNSYSSEATGDSYPWNRKDIYVDQSPLFSADKITTPLLLLHGSADTNVPLGESLQLWVGLKILGRPVEMVQVEGEDHHILTYSKRIEWHNAIMSWFGKYLKDDGADWKKMFPKSEL